MDRFALTINCTNAAFDDDPRPEIARILRELADRLDGGITQGGVHDVNGNTVGTFTFATEN
jgi:hypothetical protein